MQRVSCHRSQASFVLLEAMLGVTIFVVGILALGKAVNNCLDAGAARAEDEWARRALANRMAEIESGAVFVDVPREEKLKGVFEGITLKQERKALDLKNEKDQPITGLFVVNLEAQWMSGRQPQSKALSFYVTSTR
jgi:hypothetical protein